MSQVDQFQAFLDREQIREMYALWAERDHNKDATGWSQLFTEDAKYINPRGFEFVGRVAIEKNLHDRNTARSPEWQVVHVFGPVVVTLHGDTAEAYAEYVACARHHIDNPWTIGAVGRHHSRLVRRDGKWLFTEYRIVNPPDAPTYSFGDPKPASPPEAR